jgi:hypothetical protein
MIVSEEVLLWRKSYAAALRKGRDPGKRLLCKDWIGGVCKPTVFQSTNEIVRDGF